MYGYPVAITPFSNRETYQMFVRVADDDTGEVANLAGIIGAGTFSSWIVRAGAVITSSNTTITIPTFPHGNDVVALALTVPLALNINANDPVVLTDLSAVNQMIGYVTSYSKTTGALVVQIGCTFQWEVRAKGPRRDPFDGYTPFANPGIGTLNEGGPLLTASLADGKILYVEPGVLQIQIPETETRRMGLGTYTVGMTLSDSQVTKQVFIADLPFIYGGVTQ